MVSIRASDAFYQNQAQSASSTLFEHSCKLNIDSQPSTCRNTGIVCTIGKFYPVHMSGLSTSIGQKPLVFCNTIEFLMS